MSVESQDHMQASILNHYRRMLEFRNQHIALAKGDIEFVDVDDAILSFIRRTGEEAIFCAFNFSTETQEITVPQGLKLDWLEQHCFSGIMKPDGTISIPSYDAYFAEVAG